jgi:hypothetical protein
MGAAYLVVLFVAPAAATAESRYAIDVAESKSSILRVSLDTACSSLPCDFQLPVWSATYQLRNFSQYLGPVRAETAGGEQVEGRIAMVRSDRKLAQTASS